ncbi:MAG: VOC family protein [Phycisphaerales bacterium JB060]
MRIKLESVPVSDQDHALRFYTEKLGFVKKQDIPMGGDVRFLTVVSPEDADETSPTELMLEPAGEHPATKAYKAALVAEGIPITAFEVDDCKAEYERLKKLGVAFKGEPAEMAGTIMATLDDTCGNLVMIYQKPAE